MEMVRWWDALQGPLDRARLPEGFAGPLHERTHRPSWPAPWRSSARGSADGSRSWRSTCWPRSMGGRTEAPKRRWVG